MFISVLFGLLEVGASLGRADFSPAFVRRRKPKLAGVSAKGRVLRFLKVAPISGF
jgi:hypothetical protein